MNTEKLNSYTGDLQALITHTQKAIEEQKNSNKINHPKAVSLLTNIHVTLTDQINQFENLNMDLDEGTLASVKEKVAAAAGKVAGFIDSGREDPVSKMLRDDYTALGMIASGYTMLHTAALGTGNDELADFTKDALTHTARLITETSKVLPHIVAAELDINQVAETAEENTQECWKPENFEVEA